MIAPSLLVDKTFIIWKRNWAFIKLFEDNEVLAMIAAAPSFIYVEND
jgi:hypothetical protein